MKKIIFVCTGNTCRSAMAQFIFRAKFAQSGLKQQIKVTSAGLFAHEGEPMNELARQALRQLGYRTGVHKARVFTLDMIKKHDLIIMMTQAHASRVGNFANVRAFGELTQTKDIQDPYGLTLVDYINCAKEIENGFDAVMTALFK